MARFNQYRLSAFTPMSSQEILMPAQIMAERHAQAEQQYGAIQDLVAQMGFIAESSNDPEVKKIYSDYQSKLLGATTDLSENGVNPNTMRNILGTKSEYLRKIAPMQVAFQRRQEEQAVRDKMQMTDSSYRFKDDLPDWAEYYKNPAAVTNQKGISINQATAEAAEQFKQMQRIFQGGRFDKSIQAQIAKQIFDIYGIDPPKEGTAEYSHYIEQFGLTPEQIMAGDANPYIRSVLQAQATKDGIEGFSDSTQAEYMQGIGRAAWNALGEVKGQWLKRDTNMTEYLNAQRFKAGAEADAAALNAPFTGTESGIKIDVPTGKKIDISKPEELFDAAGRLKSSKPGSYNPMTNDFSFYGTVTERDMRAYLNAAQGDFGRKKAFLDRKGYTFLDQNFSERFKKFVPEEIQKKATKDWTEEDKKIIMERVSDNYNEDNIRTQINDFRKNFSEWSEGKTDLQVAEKMNQIAANESSVINKNIGTAFKKQSLESEKEVSARQLNNGFGEGSGNSMIIDGEYVRGGAEDIKDAYIDHLTSDAIGLDETEAKKAWSNLLQGKSEMKDFGILNLERDRGTAANMFDVGFGVKVTTKPSDLIGNMFSNISDLYKQSREFDLTQPQDLSTPEKEANDKNSFVISTALNVPSLEYPGKHFQIMPGTRVHAFVDLESGQTFGWFRNASGGKEWITMDDLYNSNSPEQVRTYMRESAKSATATN